MRTDAQGELEVLVQWEAMPEFESSWENAADIKLNFPSFHLEDQVVVQGGSYVRDLIPQGGIKVYKRRKYWGKLGNEAGMHIVRSTQPNKLAESASEGANEALGGDSVT